MSGGKHFSIREGTDGLSWLRDLRLNVEIQDYLNILVPKQRLWLCPESVLQIKKKLESKQSVCIQKKRFLTVLYHRWTLYPKMHCTEDIEELLLTAGKTKQQQSVDSGGTVQLHFFVVAF